MSALALPLLLLGLAAAPIVPAAPTDRAACNPPIVGNWTVAASCTLAGAHAVAGDVTVQPGVALTLAPGAALDLDFAHHHLRVRPGARVVVPVGAKIF